MTAFKPRFSQLPARPSVTELSFYRITEDVICRLVCTVNYVTPANIRSEMKKIFKFQVLKPLDLKTKFLKTDVRFRQSCPPLYCKKKKQLHLLYGTDTRLLCEHLAPFSPCMAESVTYMHAWFPATPDIIYGCF